MLRLEFYIPRGLEDSEEVREIDNLLNKIKTKFKLNVKRLIINEKDEDNLKSQILLAISVAKRIKIKQTRRTKSLYPQLIVFGNDKPITFYPQARVGQEITIKEFLESLLKGEIKCLHEKFEIVDELGGRK